MDRCLGSRRGTATNFTLRARVVSAGVSLVLLACAQADRAAEIAVRVFDRDGQGVGEVVVTATPAVANTGPATTPGAAVMDQRNLAFAPTAIVVGVGTQVEFPNNDSVSHQVYSFSPAKRFHLPLYKGEVHPPVSFDRPGLVVLGCNIHDAMVGYVYVTAAPYFGKTAADGELRFKSLPGGDYQIVIWSPFIADAPAALTRTVHVGYNEFASTRVQLNLALRAQPEPRPRSRDWEY